MIVDFAPFSLLTSHSHSHQPSFICREHNEEPYISEPLILVHIQEEFSFNGTEQIAQFGTGFELWYRTFLGHARVYISTAKSKLLTEMAKAYETERQNIPYSQSDVATQMMFIIRTTVTRDDLVVQLTNTQIRTG